MFCELVRASGPRAARKVFEQTGVFVLQVNRQPVVKIAVQQAWHPIVGKCIALAVGTQEHLIYGFQVIPSCCLFVGKTGKGRGGVGCDCGPATGDNAGPAG